MTVLYIRAHKRFAVRRMVSLSRSDCNAISGLLIELSLQGCRISNLGQSVEFETGQLVTLEIDGFDPITGAVRWAHDGLAGLRFDQSLHPNTLENLIRHCRTDPLSTQTQRTARA
ncbi:hypothetical protein MB02_15295 [Croceicoccus estronivorus]|nr:hypothetical protein MB02_15295 [Croceicoccus estronivorus]